MQVECRRWGRRGGKQVVSRSVTSLLFKTWNYSINQIGGSFWRSSSPIPCLKLTLQVGSAQPVQNLFPLASDQGWKIHKLSGNLLLCLILLSEELHLMTMASCPFSLYLGEESGSAFSVTLHQEVGCCNQREFVPSLCCFMCFSVSGAVLCWPS